MGDNTIYVLLLGLLLLFSYVNDLWRHDGLSVVGLNLELRLLRLLGLLRLLRKGLQTSVNRQSVDYGGNLAEEGLIMGHLNLERDQ